MKKTSDRAATLAIASALAWAGLGGCAGAHTQVTPTDASDVAVASPVQGEAKRESVPALREGMDLYRDLRFSESLAKLGEAQAALEQQADAQAIRLLQDVFIYRGMNELALGNREAATENFRASASLDPSRTLDEGAFAPEVRSLFGDVQSNLRARVPANVTVETNPVGAVLFLDGKRAGMTPITVTVPPGRHYVAFRAPGFRPHVRRIEVDGAQADPIRVVLAEEPFSRTATEEPGRVRRRLTSSPWFWGGAGVAMAAAGAAVAAFFLSRESDPVLTLSDRDSF